MMEEAFIAAHRHVAESMLKDGVDDILSNCLHGDGTSKYSGYYQNFQVTTTQEWIVIVFRSSGGR